MGRSEELSAVLVAFVIVGAFWCFLDAWGLLFAIVAAFCFFFLLFAVFSALHNFCWARHGKGICGKLWLSKPRPAKPSPAKFDIF